MQPRTLPPEPTTESGELINVVTLIDSLLIAVLDAHPDQEVICRMSSRMIYWFKKRLEAFAWVDVIKYDLEQRQAIFVGEVGRYKNVRFVIVPRHEETQFSITLVNKGL